MVAKFVRGLWRGFRPAAGRPGRRALSPCRHLVEALEGRVLLSADVEVPKPPALIGDLGLLQVAPSFDIGGASGAEAGSTGFGPPLPISIRLAGRDAGTVGMAAAFVPWSISTASLLVQDPAGNSLSSASGFGPDAAFKTTAVTNFAPQLPADASPVEYGPHPEVGPPSPDELAGLPRMPWSPSYSYTGSIDGQTSTAVRIPVGPSTRTLTLGLKPGAEGEAFLPRIDQVFLIGRGGQVMSRIVGVAILGEGESQTLFISIHGAPTGGEIVVRLVSTAALTSGDLDGQESNGPVGGGGSADDQGDAPALDGKYFELSIRRNDSGAQSGGTSPAAISGGAPYVVTLGRADVSTSIGPLAPPAEATTAQESGLGPRVVVTTAASPRDVDVDMADEGPVEVFLGPLVSRTAAALGPVLATTSDEPTPSTDRGSRSQGDGLAAFGVALDLDAILAAKGRDAVDARPDAGPALTTMRGPGGVPIVVAGLGVGDEASDAESLAASVRGAAEDDAPALADSLDAESDAESREVAHAGLATRALSFLIGMGLASGPLYPDLVALARRKFRRKPRRAGKVRRPTAG